MNDAMTLTYQSDYHCLKDSKRFSQSAHSYLITQNILYMRKLQKAKLLLARMISKKNMESLPVSLMHAAAAWKENRCLPSKRESCS